MFLRNRVRISFGIIDDRDQGAPVALPADTPVAEAVGGHTLPPSFLCKMIHDLFFGFHDVHSIEEIRIDHGSGFFLHLINVSNIAGISIGTDNHTEDRNIESGCKFKIAGIVTRNSHNGAGAKSGKHEVRDPYRHFPPIEIIDCRKTRELSCLLSSFFLSFTFSFLQGFFDILRKGSALFRCDFILNDFSNKGVFWCKYKECCAEICVGSGCEAGDGERKIGENTVMGIDACSLWILPDVTENGVELIYRVDILMMGVLSP